MESPRVHEYASYHEPLRPLAALRIFLITSATFSQRHDRRAGRRNDVVNEYLAHVAIFFAEAEPWRT